MYHTFRLYFHAVLIAKFLTKSGYYSFADKKKDGYGGHPIATSAPAYLVRRAIKRYAIIANY